MAKLKATPKTYAEAAQYLAGRNAVRLGNNTHLLRITERTYSAGKFIEGHTILAVVLHNTEIVRFHSDGRVTLHTGGYRTGTTKERLNQFVPKGGKVFQKAGHWWYNAPLLVGADNTARIAPRLFTEGINVA